VDFFLLDNRSFRTSKKLKTKKISILGMEQIDLLIEALKFSRSSFKIIAIGGQFLNDVQTHENYSNYEKERAEIIKRIDKEGIHGVIFVSGDRHAAELNKLELSDGGAIYDFTVSPLTATTYNNESEANTLRIPETYFSERNYGVIEFSGPIGDRIATLAIHRADGSHVWEHIIFQH
jgi:alkaline phosphatase D